MEKKNTLSERIVVSALIAAAYAALTYLSAVLGTAYGNIQFRLSEALNVLALFTPAAVPGLTVGCLLGNLTSPYGVVDIVLGTLATFLSAICIRFASKRCGKSAPYLAVLPPVVFNAVIVGLEITFFMPEGASAAAFFITAAQVGAGEAAVCAVLGIPLYYIVKGTKISSLL